MNCDNNRIGEWRERRVKDTSSPMNTYPPISVETPLSVVEDCVVCTNEQLAGANL